MNRQTRRAFQSDAKRVVRAANRLMREFVATAALGSHGPPSPVKRQHHDGRDRAEERANKPTG